MTDKILVVGGGYCGLSAAVALALADVACRVVVVDEFVIESRDQDLPPLALLAPRSVDKGSEWGWYQQFAGKGRKPPRY